MGLELAGILIHERLVSLDSFPTEFKTKYQLLTQFSIEPGMWMWNKPNSVFDVFADLYQDLVAKNTSADLLLTLCSVYGPSEIPSPLLRHLELYHIVKSDSANPWTQLQALIRDEVKFNIAIYELYRIFLAKRKYDTDGSLQSISLHGSICQWRFATIGDERAEWIMQATYALARHVQSEYDRQQ